MKEIIVIGTIHLNWTPESELKKVLDELKPDKLLIELSQEEVYGRKREESIRDEMFAAFDWAHENKIPVILIDVEDSPLKDGVTGKEPEFLEHELKSKELLKKYSWKDLNRQEPWEIAEVAQLERQIVEKYFDVERSKQREYKMLDNVKKNLVDGRNLVVTGAGHLTFFQKELPEAKFPFRD